MKERSKIHIRFRLSIIIANVLIISILTTGILFIVFSTSINSTRNSTDKLFIEIGDRTQEKFDAQIVCLLNTASNGAVIGNSETALRLMRNSLEQNQFLYSLYYGLEDGTFLQLIKTRGDYTILTTHNAPDETIYILRSIENLSGNRVQIWKFLDLN